MSDEQPPVDVAEVDEMRDRLEVLTPEPQPRWSEELGRALDAEARRRAIGRPRPAFLWAQTVGWFVIGLGLLSVALARVA